jgi:hypothetical protein
LDRLVHTAEEVVAHETGDDMLRYCRKVLGPAWAGQRADVGAKGLCGVIDRALLENETAAESSLHGNLQSILDARFQAASTTQAETIRGWLFALVETPKARIRGARHAARWLAKWLDNLQRETTSVLLRLAHEAESLQASAVNEASLLQYAAARVRCVPHLGVRKYLRGLRRLVQACDEEFSELARSARQLARQFATQGPKEAAGLPAHGGSLPTRLARLLQESRDELVNRFDHSLGKAMAGQEGTVASLLHGRPEQVAEWIRLMRSTACGLLRESLQAGSSPMQAGSGPRQASTVPWQVALEKASPRLLECGGTKRLIVVSPDKQAEARVGWLRSLVSLAKQDPAVFTTANCPTAICYEVEHVPLENVAVALAVDRPECLRLVPRLHTRTDVEWTPLLPSEDSR